uniref:Protein kinase n=1 Tax=Pithovirus LCPAC403 TaxID=2506596 RepID=A0A481ZBI7_9VIRU|nr:MAG: protein kinase [Pithovirus LCPAC403]
MSTFKAKKQSTFDNFRHRRLNVTNLYNQNKPVVPILSNQSFVCDKISKVKGSPVTLTKILGSGKFGEVWEASVDGSKYIAVKIPLEKLNIEENKNDSDITVGEYASKMTEKYGVNEYLTIKLNGGDSKKIILRGEKIIYPRFSEMCLTSSEKNIKGNVIPKGSYLCAESFYTEFLISLLCGELRMKKSINFINVIDMSMCPESSNEEPLYMFQEKIIGVMDDKDSPLMKATSDEDIASILIQLVHAIQCYQSNYDMNHNDLHSGNIAYSEVPIRYKDQKTEDVKYFGYIFEHLTLYIPKPKYVVKIIDFGLSCKYEETMILNLDVTNELYDGIPAFYSKFYDLGTSIISLRNRRPKSKILNASVVGGKDDYYPKFFRPKVDKLRKPPFSETNVNTIISSDLFRKYREKPEGKIMVTGIL